MILLYFFVGITLFAQTDTVAIEHANILIDHKDPIYIYDSAFSTRPSRVIQIVPELENSYSFFVINDSIYRFQVEIWESLTDDNPRKSVGWVDKINTNVYLGIREYNDGSYLKLYEKPCEKSKYIKVSENDHMTMLGYVDKINGKWYHVNVIYKGVVYMGWTCYYNVNPYCS